MTSFLSDGLLPLRAAKRDPRLISSPSTSSSSPQPPSPPCRVQSAGSPSPPLRHAEGRWGTSFPSPRDQPPLARLGSGLQRHAQAPPSEIPTQGTLAGDRDDRQVECRTGGAWSSGPLRGRLSQSGTSARAPPACAAPGWGPDLGLPVQAGTGGRAGAQAAAALRGRGAAPVPLLAPSAPQHPGRRTQGQRVGPGWAVPDAGV